MNARDTLKNVQLFSGLSPRFLEGLGKACTERTFNKGDVIVRQGNPGVGLFIISKGAVKVVKTNEAGSQFEVGRHGPGDVIGEMSVIDGAPRSADVIAEEDTTCFALTSWDFNSFMKTHPQVALEILPVVVGRFRDTNKALITMKESST